jgi:predicted DNA-binding transcriptional regulator AlpA
LLPRAEDERATGFKRSAIYARIAAGTFPAPLREPGTGTVRWLEPEVVAWIEAVCRTWPRGAAAAARGDGV